MPFPTAHNPGNPGSERYPIPTSASSSDSHKTLYIPSNGMSSSLLLHMPTLRPSRLLTQTGAPQRPKAAFASSGSPQNQPLPVWGTSQSAGARFREAPSFHSFTKSPPPLSGMKAATSSHLLGRMKQGVPPPRHPPPSSASPPETSFHFRLLLLSP